MDNHHSSFNWYRRVGQLISRYYSMAPWPFEPTLSEYEHWLLSLPIDERTLYGRLGFTACQSVNAFRRHWVEQRDYRLLDYLRMHLNRDDYQAYRHACSPLQLYQRRSEPLEQLQTGNG